MSKPLIKDSAGTWVRWPLEAASAVDAEFRWDDGSANRVLDMHGDPTRAQLTVVSDGNHHMALQACAQAFVANHDGLDDIFYLTLPPPALSPMLEAGGLWMGNLRLPVRPHVVLGPRGLVRRHMDSGLLAPPAKAFARSRGNVLLVRKGNPLGIESVGDVMRPDVRLFISHPEREKASFEVYANTLCNMAEAEGFEAGPLKENLRHAQSGVVHGRAVHHREVPAAVAGGVADTAMVYFHLGLRYTRIFPELFDMVMLPGSDADAPHPLQEVTQYYVGQAAQPGAWGAALVEFLLSEGGRALYREHGLLAPDSDAANGNT